MGRMKVFMTWSGERSKAVALALRQWIPDVINTAAVWMSEVDIPAGDRWNASVARELEQAQFGVICLTKANLREPWVLFEAGALAKQLSNSYVCPYLIDLQPVELPSGPLTQFQAKQANRAGTFDLIAAINDTLGAAGLSPDRLQRSFARCWPDLERQLGSLPQDFIDATPERSTGDMLREVLDLARELTRRVRGQEELLRDLIATPAEAPPPPAHPRDFSHLRQEPKDVQAFLDETRT